MQTAAKLVPWLDSPKNDHVTDHEAACLDTMVDMDADTMPDSQSRDAAAAPAMLADTVVDRDADTIPDSPQSLKSADHEAEGLDTYLDTMTEQWPGEVAFLSDVQESESMDSMVDMDTDSQNQDMAEVPAILADTVADIGADSETTGVREAFLDITDLDEPGEIDGMGLRRPPVAISLAPAPAADDESQVEVRAREMAAEAWDCADARTFQTCEGEFEQFWMCRKRHFMDQARQKLAAS
jgi:hypothetical protein